MWERRRTTAPEQHEANAAPDSVCASRPVGMDTGRFVAGMCVFLLSLEGFMSSPGAMGSCPDRCDCQHQQHIMCTNRGLRTVPKASAPVPEEVLVFSLGGNFIGNISAFDFPRYSDLRRLNLQYNQIQTIHPKAFEKLSSLEELYLGHNRLSTLQVGTLQPLKKLTLLDCNNNEMTKITPELFADLENLVKLRLDGNAIEVLPDSVFKDLTGLHHLHLESNRLHHIHGNAFSKLTNLRFLSLARNRQSSVRNLLTFSHLKALSTLLLSENQIQHVESRVFQNLTKLSKLSLSNNRISRLDDSALKGLSSLKELLIDGNQLLEIPAGLLDPLERIRELDFSRNQISKVDSLAFKQLQHLNVLRLKDNILTSLSGDMFALNNLLYDLDLNGNNWTCDCRLEELKRWMTAAHSQGKLLTAFILCHHPEALRGKYLDYVNSSHQCGSPAGPEESRGEVLVKMDGTGPGEGDRGGDGLVEQLVTVQREEKRKRERQEEVGIQGDQGGVEVVEPSSSLDIKKLKKESKSRPATDAVRKRARGKQRSNVISRTDSPAFPTPGPAGNQERTSTDQYSGVTTTSLLQSGEKFDLLRSDDEEGLPVITDPCVFNRHYITNVSVDEVTASTVIVYWTTRDHHRFTPGLGPGEVHYRILFDRFGTPDRFPRYVYARGSARSVTLRELSSDVTYVVCVEGVVGGSVCPVAPRDHCSGLVTLSDGGLSPSGRAVTSDLQFVTVAILIGNAVLLLVVGGVWLGRSLKKRLQRRKTAVHVRHMYSTRRPFRPNMATSSVSADFTSYQSSRAARLAPLEEGDLIEFPCERFQDNSCIRRDSDMPGFSD